MRVCSLITTVVCVCLLGYACPVDSASPDWKVAIELNDGGRIVGDPAFKSIRFQTGANGKDTVESDVPLRSFYSAWLGDEGWVAHTEHAESLTGKILNDSLRVKTLVGPVTVPIRLAVGLEVYSTTIDADLPVRKDLVLYLNFDRNGGKRARNLASFRHHAEVRVARWTADGKHGGAYEFDGDAQLVIPHHAELCPKAYTLAAWVFPQDPSDGPWRHVICKTKPGFYGGYSFCRYPKDNANVSFYVGDYNSALVKQPIPQRQWSHIAGVCDGKQVQLFVNGEPSPPLPLPRKMEHTKTPFIIGGFGGYNWIGKVDEVVLFRRALSDQEIRQLMLAGSKRNDS